MDVGYNTIEMINEQVGRVQREEMKSCDEDQKSYGDLEMDMREQPFSEKEKTNA